MSADTVVIETSCEGKQPFHRGKVRDVYDLGDKYLLITTDRVSAYDVVMNQGIPNKGRVLHGITKFWMESFLANQATHFISDELGDIGPPWSCYKEIFEGRCMLVRKMKPLPIEAIVRGYICGSGWNEYVKSQAVCGVKLPAHLNQNQSLYRPIFTPSTKAKEGHDQNITCKNMEDLLTGWLCGYTDPSGPKIDEVIALGHTLAGMIHQQSIALYERAAELLWNRGIIMADTKMEWAFEMNGLNGPLKHPAPCPLHESCQPRLVLIDEFGTPDSSRFWDFKNYGLGGAIPSLDKQILRDWLDESKWIRKPPAPDLPSDLISRISDRYLEIYERIVGSPLT